jgi:hypothetical protein
VGTIPKSTVYFLSKQTMVLGSALCALNLASSFMVNGVCCYYQMQEEEEKRKEQHEAIQKAIRFEIDRNRHMDKEEKLLEKHSGVYGYHLREQRRRKLMVTKNTSAGGVHPTSSDGSSGRRDQPLRHIETRPEGGKITFSSRSSDISAYSAPMPEINKLGQPELLKRPLSMKVVKRSSYSEFPGGQLNSLLDSSEDDDDDGDLESVTIE